ncbi:MAG: response regulator receiver protein [Deltaproteobacteria bacterium]|nr:response regulator receiver protein [Deltaproteobacteria bacterium]
MGAAMKKILIFDAYSPIRQLLAEEITAEGYVTMSIGKPETLNESIARFEPDLIVLDLYTRGGMLWDLLEDLKSRYPAVPVLLFTAFHPQEIPRFKQADGWVQKNFQFEELKEKIRVLLAQRENPSAFRQPILAKDSNQIGFPGSSASAALTSVH